MARGSDNKPDLEKALAAILDTTTNRDCPPTLANAIHYAVFPGGARIRPKLCLAVAAANQCEDGLLALHAACAVELLHCASLVHDDMPCFDDAELRRGKPSAHRAFGEPIALLVGDALIVAAFDALAVAVRSPRAAECLPSLSRTLAKGTGARGGICAGQAWESEDTVDVALYHRAKTGALFVAATCGGAAACGMDPEPWATLGNSIGEAYQVADDIQDAVCTSEQLGKPCQQDQHLGRPSAVRELGIQGAAQRLRELVEAGLDSVPDCPGRDQLLQLVRAQAQGFLPKELNRYAA
jgi:geranylgeranyl diphosphate synthase type II